VGLDPRIELMPAFIKSGRGALAPDVVRSVIRDFHELVLDTIAGLASIVKLGIKAFNGRCCRPVRLPNPPDFRSLPAAGSITRLATDHRPRSATFPEACCSPSYMLLDEPFAGIDPIAVGDIQALVRHLTNRGIGVLITDHNVRETLGLTDRAYIIYSGEVLMEGRPDDIVNNPDVRRLYLGEEFRL
jgi:hypothetical protein